MVRGRRSVTSLHAIFHASVFYLLSLFFLALGLDEQADAGDVAVRDVAAGLLAAEKKCGVRNAECGA